MLGLLLAAPAFALDAALMLAGATQGGIAGGNTISGREGTIVVLGYAGTLVTPASEDFSFIAAPQCRALTIRKPVDMATPKLLQAWGATEVMSTFELKFYRSNSQSGTENFFTITLEDAIVLSISQAGGDNEDQYFEQIRFGFSQIVYSDPIATVSAQYNCLTGTG